jgi:hypothetical protein
MASLTGCLSLGQGPQGLPTLSARPRGPLCRAQIHDGHSRHLPNRKTPTLNAEIGASNLRKVRMIVGCVTPVLRHLLPGISILDGKPRSLAEEISLPRRK